MSPIPTENQISAGGVAYRVEAGQIFTALILVGPYSRWQLPKGAANDGESNEQAALREVREETGLNTSLVEPIDRIEYWFYATRNGQRIRYHKFVYFFLMRYCSGSVADHDHEVIEARWFDIDEAIELLAFESEKGMVRKAREQIMASIAENASADCFD